MTHQCACCTHFLIATICLGNYTHISNWVSVCVCVHAMRVCLYEHINWRIMISLILITIKHQHTLYNWTKEELKQFTWTQNKRLLTQLKITDLKVLLENIIKWNNQVQFNKTHLIKVDNFTSNTFNWVFAQFMQYK